MRITEDIVGEPRASPIFGNDAYSIQTGTHISSWVDSPKTIVGSHQNGVPTIVQVQCTTDVTNQKVWDRCETRESAQPDVLTNPWEVVEQALYRDVYANEALSLSDCNDLCASHSTTQANSYSCVKLPGDEETTHH